MSFILDALKKSEQERRQRGIPDLHTEHAPMATPRGRVANWPIFIILALLLNAGLLLWWLRPWQPPRQAENQTSPVMKTEQAPPIPATPAGSTTVSVTAVTPTTQTEAATPLPSAPIESVQVREMVVAPAPMAVAIPAEKDLPPQLRAELPEIEISLHFFTSAPSARMVRINGRNLREGQLVNPHLTLQEITAEGVVLEFKGHVFTASR